MFRQTFISRSRFTFVAFLLAFVCVSTVGCGPNPAQQRAAVEKAQAQLRDYAARLGEQTSEQKLGLANGDANDPKKIFGQMGKNYAEFRDNIRSIETRACPADYKTGLKKVETSVDAVCAYLSKLESGEVEDSEGKAELVNLLLEFAESVSELDEIAAKYGEE